MATKRNSGRAPVTPETPTLRSRIEDVRQRSVAARRAAVKSAEDLVALEAELERLSQDVQTVGL